MPPAGRAPLAPILLTFVSAILWGLWWIPIRWIEGMGLSGAQAGIICNLGAALAIGGYMVATRMRLRLSARTILGAALVGLAFASYSLSLTLSDVVRAILLFYLAPAWSKLIEWAFMGQRWHGTSTATLILSLAGAYLVLGGEVSLAALNLGDVLALGSGMAWAAGAALVFSGEKSTTSALTLATVISAMVLSLGFAVLTGDVLPDTSPAAGPGLITACIAALIIGALYLLPVLGVTMWSAQRLPPGLLSFLFTLEIVAGVTSGALLLDEPFGLYQLSTMRSSCR